MDLQKLLEDCDTIETTISLLIKDNAFREIEVVRLQEDVFDYTKANLDSTLDKERELNDRLDEIVAKKLQIETEIKQYTSINEKLTELVAVAQKRTTQEVDDELELVVAEAYGDYLQIKSNFAKTKAKFHELELAAKRETNEVQALIHGNSELLVDMYRNDSLIRVLDQQNKYAEQQFDLVLNEIPWEPLTKQYLEVLLASSNQSIRDLAGFIQIQANEIDELNDSLALKKRRKLEALENLQSELVQFVQRRDEAVTVARLID